jgi:hypothetical protein
MKTLVLTASLIVAAGSLRGGDRLPAAPAPAGSGFTGKVLETTNAASYTYLLVDTGKATNWAAASQFAVKVGDTVTVTDTLPMPRYHSQTLNRDFDVVYFSGSVTVAGAVVAPADPAVALPKNHPPIGGVAAPAAVDFSGLQRAKDGKTVEEINTHKAKLSGKRTTVRGKVVKYNASVMGKNWLHIRDGSGGADSNDLTITTATEAKVGDTVLVSGKVATNRDFGGGYKYSVIIEDATVVVE